VTKLHSSKAYRNEEADSSYSRRQHSKDVLKVRRKLFHSFYCKYVGRLLKEILHYELISNSGSPVYNKSLYKLSVQFIRLQHNFTTVWYGWNKYVIKKRFVCGTGDDADITFALLLYRKRAFDLMVHWRLR
jgi:hypothetical protein